MSPVLCVTWCVDFQQLLSPPFPLLLEAAPRDSVPRQLRGGPEMPFSWDNEWLHPPGIVLMGQSLGVTCPGVGGVVVLPFVNQVMSRLSIQPCEKGSLLSLGFSRSKERPDSCWGGLHSVGTKP